MAEMNAEAKSSFKVQNYAIRGHRVLKYSVTGFKVRKSMIQGSVQRSEQVHRSFSVHVTEMNDESTRRLSPDVYCSKF